MGHGGEGFEIHYPQSWYIFSDTMQFGTLDQTFQIGAGYYYDVCSIVKFMNVAVKKHPPPLPNIKHK